MHTISDTYIENRQRVQPTDANNLGTAHGGNVVKWMDDVGALSAMRHSGESCVTARINSLDFERPIPQGETCIVESYVFSVGRTSMRVRLQAYREDPRSGERERTTHSYFVFVAVDENGTPTEVPDLEVETSQDQRLREAALEGQEELE